MADHLKRILLYGRTGAGKSTLGNMLDARHPSPQGGFQVGDGLRGVSSKVDLMSGNGWLVTDTIGMGESDGGTVTTAQAEAQLLGFLKQLKFTYSYLIYVVRKGRAEDAQAVTWNMFKKMFEGAERNFVVVFTSANETWLLDNMLHIREAFPGCDQFCAVDIPTVHNDDPEMENLLHDRRLQSIKNLEKKLESFNLPLGIPKISRMTDTELLAHVKMTIMDAVQYITTHFAFAVDNPVTWIIRKMMARLM